MHRFPCGLRPNDDRMDINRDFPDDSFFVLKTENPPDGCPLATMLAPCGPSVEHLAALARALRPKSGLGAEIQRFGVDLAAFRGSNRFRADGRAACASRSGRSPPVTAGDRRANQERVCTGGQVTFTMSGKYRSHRSYSAAACFSQLAESLSRKSGPAKSAP